MTHDGVAAWLERYVEAWKSYDRDQIGDLFSEDVVCRYRPFDKPFVGRKAVVDSWLGEAEQEGAPGLDEPGTFEAEYGPVAVDGQTAVAVGRSSYRDEPGGEIKRVYFNCFVMRFDDEGRCSEFTEWFMLEQDA